MKRALMFASLCLLLGGCSDMYGVPPEFRTPRLGFIGDSSAPADSRAELCRFAREAMGLPIRIDPTLRSKAYATLGSSEAARMFRPVARTNNAFRCLCGTPAERVNAKC